MNEISALLTPLVSVCIPTYNRASRLRRAVDHLLSIAYSNLEIIISDNASTDDTQKICAELSNQDSRVRYFRHPLNLGPIANFEFARTQANGKYFLWLSDDDYLGPNFISLCVEALEKNPALILASGLSAFHRGDHATTHHGDGFQLESSFNWLRVIKFIFLVEDGSIFCGLYRRAEVMHCKVPNCLGGDHIWLMEVLLQGKGRVIYDTLVYREFGDSTSSSMERLISVLGAAPWHARYPWIALPLNLANHLAFHSNARRGRFWPVNLWVWLLILTIALSKQAIALTTLKLPFGKQIYRWIFLNTR